MKVVKSSKTQIHYFVLSQNFTEIPLLFKKCNYLKKSGHKISSKEVRTFKKKFQIFGCCDQFLI